MKGAGFYVLCCISVIMAVTDGMLVSSWNPAITPIFYSFSDSFFFYLLPHLSRSLSDFHLSPDSLQKLFSFNGIKKPFKLPTNICGKTRYAVS